MTGIDECQATPYFTLDPAELTRNVAGFRRALPSTDLFYAVKANPDQTVLRTLASEGCSFEAASWYEIEDVLKLDIEPDRILYGTAVKPATHVEQAVAAGITRFTADSREEIQMLAKSAPGSQILIRVRVDDASSLFHMNDKFGALPDNVIELVRQAVALGLTPWGLSFHVGSQAQFARTWRDAIAALHAPIVALYEDRIELPVLDIGGGFPGSYANHPVPPTLEEIAAAIDEGLTAWPYRPRLLAEPGRALVASCMSFTASVIARVERADGPWLFLDGGVYNGLVEAGSHQGDIRYAVELIAADIDGGDELPFTLAGPTGDALDTIGRDIVLPAGAAAGQQLRFHNAGAYTLPLTSTFNGFPKPSVRQVGGSEVHHQSTDGPIDTVASRLAIGFPEGPAEWCEAEANFSKHELKILGHPVMEDWEQGYMSELAGVATKNGGVVLEVGYGMGLAATAIQRADITRHVIIECHPDVVARCLQDWRGAIAEQRLQLLVGLWQNVTSTLADATFDGILFDTYPLRASEIHGNHFGFFDEAFRLLKPGGIFTYYSDEAATLPADHMAKLVAAGFDGARISSRAHPVRPPAGCEYWQAESLVVPVVWK